jgi:hypothetical protein
VEAKVAAFDILNIKLLFSDDSLASFNEDVAEELKKKTSFTISRIHYHYISVPTIPKTFLQTHLLFQTRLPPRPETATIRPQKQCFRYL